MLLAICHRRTKQAGRGVVGMQLQLCRIFQMAISGKNHVIVGQNNLMFGQVMEKLFGQETSPPPPPRTKLVPSAHVPFAHTLKRPLSLVKSTCTRTLNLFELARLPWPENIKPVINYRPLYLHTDKNGNMRV